MKEGPYFFAWCDEAQRVDALGAALSALVKDDPTDLSVILAPEAKCHTTTVSEAVAAVRAHFGRTNAEIYLTASLSNGRFLHSILRGFSDKSERQKPSGPLHMHPREIEKLVPMGLDLNFGSGRRSMESEAVVAWQLVVANIEDVLLHVCAPDASGRVSTGGCTTAWTWIAPLSMCATYNADAREIARDLALSWVSLHDKERVSLLAGMSLSALHARVDAAPVGATVFPRDNSGRSISLSRETVLKALDTPGSALVDALEAAASVPDPAWRAAEPRAREIFDLSLQSQQRNERLNLSGKGPGLRPIELTGAHVYFLVDHAPFLVNRLPGGGVLMATHPYRTLWPLWVDALVALGLMA